MSYLVQTERFEGPLGLLLHLIRKEEMDIFDININQITRQYLDFIKAMKHLDLEVAGEFVAMAATLIHIKSRMLLPQYNEDGEIDESEDPRKELVNRLLEYQKFQEASAQLYERPLLGRDIFLKGRREDVETPEDDEVVVEEENALFALIASYRSAIRNMKKSIHKVGTELQSIAERIMEIKESLRVGVRMQFGELIQTSESKREQVLVTFLSLLELAKMGFVSLFQNDSYSEIHLEAKKEIDGDVMSRVEDYDNNAGESSFGFLDEESSNSEPSGGEAGGSVDLTEGEVLELDGLDPVEQMSLEDSVSEPVAEEMATDDDIEEELEKMRMEDVSHKESVEENIQKPPMEPEL